MTTIPEGQSNANLIEEGDNTDLFEVTDLLEGNQPAQPRSPQLGKAAPSVKKIINDQQNMLLLEGQFSITKGYGNDQRAKMFSVGNPHVPKGQDYFMYTVFVSLTTLLSQCDNRFLIGLRQ
jgi:hypothetical protein